jgi:hypothetical protein
VGCARGALVILLDEEPAGEGVARRGLELELQPEAVAQAAADTEVVVLDPFAGAALRRAQIPRSCFFFASKSSAVMTPSSRSLASLSSSAV